uniref:Uncharacterized protein n=1 Tax=Candidatus Methanogaster sp. ANME-2c ERB4 TaxID=2759911 RepID=A0A7G9YRB2_9EURY|nr:hypothetical protein HGEBJNHG_00019 [Methanosarcinales archaeon ANME-2c ERB4]
MREVSENPLPQNLKQKREPGGVGKHHQHGTTIASTHRDCARRGIVGLHRRKNK